MQHIDFYYDFGSPKSYFVYKILPQIAAKHNANILPRPVLLGGIFKLSNNKSPVEAFADVKGKMAYDTIASERFVTRHKLAFKFNPHFPVMTIGVMRGAIYALGKDWQERYTQVVFEAMLVNAKKMNDPSVIGEVLTEGGLPTKEIMVATQTPEVKSSLIDATNEAAARNIFGAPTMFVGDEMFFGKEGVADIDYYLDQM